jgi:hypothetical protein
VVAADEQGEATRLVRERRPGARDGQEGGNGEEARDGGDGDGPESWTWSWSNQPIGVPGRTKMSIQSHFT